MLVLLGREIDRVTPINERLAQLISASDSAAHASRRAAGARYMRAAETTTGRRENAHRPR